MKEIIKGAGIIFIVKVFGAVALFFINIIISNLYGAVHLGVFNLIFALLQLTSIVSRAGLDVFIVKTLPTIDSPERISSFLKKTAKLILTLSLITALFVIIFASEIDKFLFHLSSMKEYIIITGMLIVPYTFFTILPEVLRGFESILNYSILRNTLLNISIITALVSLYQFANFENEPILALFFGISAASIISFFIVIYFLRKKSIPFKSKVYKENILRQSFPMFMTSSILFLMNNVDSFMIGYFENEEQVGYYNACVRLSFGITFILASINGFLGPKFSKIYHNNNIAELRNLFFRSIRLIWFTVLPIIILLFMFPDFFLGLFGEKFKSVHATLMILNLSFLVNSIFGPNGLLLNMTNRQKYVMVIIIFSVLLNITLNVILIPIYGIFGAALSTLISGIFWNVLLFIKCIRVFNE